MGWKEDLVANLRGFWPDVVETPGWKTRGNGANWANGSGPQASMNHHLVVPEDPGYEDDAVSLGINGHSALPGPICNTLIAYDGTIHLVAGNPANHAGQGVRDVLNRILAGQPPRGNAADVYGAGSDNMNGNTTFFGAELQHRGTHPDYPPNLIRATYAWNAALDKTFGWPVARNIHHREWSARKIDLSWRGDLRAGTALVLDGSIQPLPGDWWRDWWAA